MCLKNLHYWRWHRNVLGVKITHFLTELTFNMSFSISKTSYGVMVSIALPCRRSYFVRRREPMLTDEPAIENAVDPILHRHTLVTNTVVNACQGLLIPRRSKMTLWGCLDCCTLTLAQDDCNQFLLEVSYKRAWRRTAISTPWCRLKSHQASFIPLAAKKPMFRLFRSHPTVSALV